MLFIFVKGNAAFQSTLPAGEATNAIISAPNSFGISIHASRGGSDHNLHCTVCQRRISIHASRGGSDEIFGNVLR